MVYITITHVGCVQYLLAQGCSVTGKNPQDEPDSESDDEVDDDLETKSTSSKSSKASTTSKASIKSSSKSSVKTKNNDDTSDTATGDSDEQSLVSFEGVLAPKPPPQELAVRYGHEDIVRCLLKARASLDADYGKTRTLQRQPGNAVFCVFCVLCSWML